MELTLQTLHDDQLIGVHALAFLLGTTAGQIYKLNSTDPGQLPPRVAAGGRKLTWRLGTCRAWIRGLPEVKCDGAEDRPLHRGRPRSVATRMSS